MMHSGLKAELGSGRKMKLAPRFRQLIEYPPISEEDRLSVASEFLHTWLLACLNTSPMRFLQARGVFACCLLLPFISSPPVEIYLCQCKSEWWHTGGPIQILTRINMLILRPTTRPFGACDCLCAPPKQHAVWPGEVGILSEIFLSEILQQRFETSSRYWHKRCL